MTFGQVSDYIKKHEFLIVIVLVLAFITGGYSRVTDWLDRRADKAVAVALAASNAQKQADKELTDQLSAQVKDYKTLVDKLAAENKTLTAHQVQVTVATEKQQKIDETLPPDQLAIRWDNLVNTSGVAPATDGSYVVTDDAARKTVETLETVPELNTLLQDQKNITANDETQLAGLEKLSATQDELLAGLRAEISKNDTACKAEVAQAKAVARKSKLRWFGAGVILGALARNLIGL